MAATTTSSPDLQAHNRGNDTYGSGNALRSDSALLIGEQSGHRPATTPREGRRGRLGLYLGKRGHELVTGLLDFTLNGLRGTGIAHRESLAARPIAPYPCPYCEQFAVTKILQ